MTAVLSHIFKKIFSNNIAHFYCQHSSSLLDNDIFKAKTTTNVVTNHLPITKEKVPEAHEKKENKLLKVSFKGTQDYFKNQSID
jgi:hypothetical protein